MLSVDEINNLQKENAELKAENKRLNKVAFQCQNASIHMNKTLEKYEERINKLEQKLFDWITAYKELEDTHNIMTRVVSVTIGEN